MTTSMSHYYAIIKASGYHVVGVAVEERSLGSSRRTGDFEWMEAIGLAATLAVDGDYMMMLVPKGIDRKERLLA